MKESRFGKFIKDGKFVIVFGAISVAAYVAIGLVTRSQLINNSLLTVKEDLFLKYAWILGLLNLLAIVVVCFMIQLNQRKTLQNQVEIATDELRISLALERQRTEIINALADTYICLYYVDLNDYEYKELVSKDYLREIIKPRGDVREALTRYVYKGVGNEEQTRMLKFCDVTTLKSRLDGQKQIVENYNAILINGLCKASFTVVDADENDNPLHVIFACQYIDEDGELSDKHLMITELEKLRADSKKKNDFLLNVGEDIRTPINGIINLIGIASANASDTDRVLDCLTKIDELSQVLLNYTSDIVDLTRVETGKLELKKEVVNIDDFAIRLEAKSTPRAALKEQLCRINVENIVHHEVIGDESALNNIFMSLLNNSMKYTPKMGTIDFILAERPSRHRGYACFEVEIKDRGIGMTDAYLKMALDAAPRGIDTTVTGTGLNLPSIRNMLRMMDGDIKVISKQREGTTFKVTFFLKTTN